MFGLPDETLVRRLVDALADGEARAALEAAAELLARGLGVDRALETLAEHLRHLMVVAACGPESELLELSPDARQAAAEQARRFDVAALVHMIAVCDSAARNAKASAAARALFDAAIVRLAMSEHLADIPGLLAGTASAVSAAPGKKKELGRPSPLAAESPSKPSFTELKPPASPTKSADARASREAARKLPLVAKAAEIFEAEIVEVEELPEDEVSDD